MAQTTGFTVWLTGMIGSGKSTLANYLAQRFRAVGRRVEVLDADEMAELVLQGLGNGKEERIAATRRIGYVARLLTRNDTVAICAAISPYREARDQVRREVNRFAEVFVDCATETLISRDTTGQYKKALAGELPNFTGITDPYETPQHAEITVHTDQEPVEDSCARIVQGLVGIGYLTPAEGKDMLGRRVRPLPAKGKAAKPAKPSKAGKAGKAAVPAPKAKVAKPAKAPVAAAKARRPAKVKSAATHQPRAAKREAGNRVAKKASRR